MGMCGCCRGVWDDIDGGLSCWSGDKGGLDVAVGKLRGTGGVCWYGQMVMISLRAMGTVWEDEEWRRRKRWSVM